MIVGIGNGVGFKCKSNGSVPPSTPIYQTINGYKYTQEVDAINAIQLCAANNIITIYHTTQYDSPVFWYIDYLPGMELFLGQPQQFSIIIGYA